jgi:hypothetical protein
VSYQPPPGPDYRHTAPGWPPQPAPAKKRGPLAWALGAIVGTIGLCTFIGIIGALADNPDDTAPAAEAGATPDTGAAPTKAKPPAKEVAGIGDKVRDGKFEFVVTGMDCSKTKVGNQYLNAKAQGKFCMISVTVTNIGDEAQLFTGSNQLAYAGETEFKNDSTAGLYANSDSQTFLEDVNPGNSVKGELIFDVPKKTTLTEIELHDSFLSGGVRVSLA